MRVLRCCRLSYLFPIVVVPKSVWMTLHGGRDLQMRGRSKELEQLVYGSLGNKINRMRRSKYTQPLQRWGLS